jgi:hypothetical protein
MLNEFENNYIEKWTYVQRTQQFQKRVITGLIGLVGILAIILIITGNEIPLVVEKENSIYRSLPVIRTDLKPTKESVAELVTEFIKVRYEWESFQPQVIIKKLEPFTTAALREKLFEEFGKKGVMNKPGESIEQSIARVKPDISEKAVLASFDRILRINGVPIIVPTEISLLLSEGPKTFFNPMGLYINGIIEHENR